MIADGEVPTGSAGTLGDWRSGGHACSGPVNAQTEATNVFTLHMFARLCLFLGDDPVVRLASQGTGQELTMEQQRNRVNRDDYWQTVADRFNSSDFNRVMEMPTTSLPLEIIDPSAPPPTPVTGAKLKTMWTDMRGPYTEAHKDFEKSGQNDPTIGGTLRFLKKKESGPGRGELYALSKRILVMFIVMRIGSDNAGNDDQGATAKSMLDMTLRMIPNG